MDINIIFIALGAIIGSILVNIPKRKIKNEAQKYIDAIRKHRDQRGDDRCWLDDEELYKILPEGYESPKRDSCVELERCKKYIESRHNPNVEYVSPQRRIEELEKRLGKYPSYCCQRCGEQIGWVGRVLDLLGDFHNCNRKKA